MFKIYRAEWVSWCFGWYLWQLESKNFMALGDEEKALSAFKSLVEQGIHSTRLIQDVNLQPLYNNKEYKRLIKVIEKNLEIERVKLRKKQENGELTVLLPNSNRHLNER
ncbi:MAG: hypothetical protein V3U92_15305 [Cellulophaga sp.]